MTVFQQVYVMINLFICPCYYSYPHFIHRSSVHYRLCHCAIGALFLARAHPTDQPGALGHIINQESKLCCCAQTWVLCWRLQSSQIRSTHVWFSRCTGNKLSQKGFQLWHHLYLHATFHGYGIHNQWKALGGGLWTRSAWAQALRAT